MVKKDTRAHKDLYFSPIAEYLSLYDPFVVQHIKMIFHNGLSEVYLRTLVYH